MKGTVALLIGIVACNLVLQCVNAATPCDYCKSCYKKVAYKECYYTRVTYSQSYTTKCGWWRRCRRYRTAYKLGPKAYRTATNVACDYACVNANPQNCCRA